MTDEVSSPFLFCIFLNDFEIFLHHNQASAINKMLTMNKLWSFYSCLFLYADDTVLFSDNELGMQQVLGVFEKYFKEWKLTVNTEK